jgi:hypothetical protein
MAGAAQALRVAQLVEAAFGQWLDVISHRGQLHTASCPAFNAQRIGCEQLIAQPLQLAAGDSLGDFGPLNPGFMRVALAPTATATHQYTAAGMAAGLWGCEWHRRSRKDKALASVACKGLKGLQSRLAHALHRMP